MSYMDYFASDEYLDLAYWGSPDWYTGKDYADRKYKPQYKAIEDWVLYGIRSEKDGDYYHMPPPNPLKSGTSSESIRTDMFFGQSIYTATDTFNTPPTAPYWVLPKEGSKLQKLNMYAYTMDAYNAELSKKMKAYKLVGWQLGDAYTLDVAAFDNKWGANPQMKPLLAKMATCSAADFEANWEKWIKLAEDCGSAAIKPGIDILVKNWKDPKKTIPLD